MSRRIALAVIPLVLIVSALAACTQSARIPPAEPPSATEPLFASDEEALEAATAAYEEYLAASNKVASSPPFELGVLEKLATSDYLERERESLARLEDQGWRISGQSTVTASELQQRYADATLGEVVVIYVCVDVSNARVLAGDGSDVTPSDRSEMVTLEVEFVEGQDSGLILNRSDAWSGDPVC